MKFLWLKNEETVNWQELADLYKSAPLGDKSPEDLRTVFSNSMFKCFVFAKYRDTNKLIGIGRALADGLDTSYICDIAIHPDYQDQGLGKAIVNTLVEYSSKHKKILLYAVPGKEGFYQKLGFRKMNTAMAIFSDQQRAFNKGIIS
ncbi:MAG: GNAT family N-acetyltransferase [Colwellia sp.]|nr:GNAT family N-acetyltransferase [Colwellia sp.]